MRVVIQRAKNAKCTVDGQITGQIDYGYCIFVGFNNEDTNEIIDKMIHKILFLRIFEDENQKMNKSIKDIHGEILIISQFIFDYNYLISFKNKSVGLQLMCYIKKKRSDG